MLVSTILHRKGHGVTTVASTTTTADVVAILAEQRIGAAVVTDDGTHIIGIVSERDIVHAIARDGVRALDSPVGALMTTEVFTCNPDTTVEQLMTLMTERRVRHVPVVVDGALAGIISIGDVVKDRITSLEHEAQALSDYITNPR